jgi:hypothetical protein
MPSHQVLHPDERGGQKVPKAWWQDRKVWLMDQKTVLLTEKSDGLLRVSCQTSLLIVHQPWSELL